VGGGRAAEGAGAARVGATVEAAGARAAAAMEAVAKVEDLAAATVAGVRVCAVCADGADGGDGITSPGDSISWERAGGAPSPPATFRLATHRGYFPESL